MAQSDPHRFAIIGIGVILLYSALANNSVGQDKSAAAETLRTDSRSPFVHRLTLYDGDGKAISPSDEPTMPYSPRATCGKCHPYQTISGGWHFNAHLPDVEEGRAGEPCILIDLRTGTQLPLSLRGWPGTWKPEEIGMSAVEFTERFGRHLPGGGWNETAAQTADDPQARWNVTGALEIDCMSCHNADLAHDQTQRARQIEAMNFRWTPVVTSQLATVRGEARKAPDDWDPLLPPDPDFPEQAGPVTQYDPTRFDPEDRVLFNITRTPPPERCYFCHSFRQAGADRLETWRSDGDVHVTHGMKCVDCHRNGIDHMITRGYEGEPTHGGSADVRSLSCAGCHYGSGEKESDPRHALGGRLGSPRTDHPGLPPIHFDKMTCAACHAGPWPGERPLQFQTAMAHTLGLAEQHRREDAPPQIVGPVFRYGADGKLAPHRMFWPAFWAEMRGEEILPLAPERVAELAGAALGPKKVDLKNWQPLPRERIENGLKALAANGSMEGKPVYLAGGLLWRLDDSGQFVSESNPAAAPYAWALGHDVRPAAQSLGARGCTDCHAPDAPIFFGQVAANAPAALEGLPVARMIDLMPGDAPLQGLLGEAFRLRPAYKLFGFLAVGVVALVLLIYGLRGGQGLLRRIGGGAG